MLLKNNSLTNQAQIHCKNVMKSISTFNSRFHKLVGDGLPTCWDKNGNLLPQTIYRNILITKRKQSSHFVDLPSFLKQKVIYDYIEYDFQLLWQVKNLFRVKLNYEKFIDLVTAYRDMVGFPYPYENEWKICMISLT